MMREVVQEPALVSAEPERLQSLLEGILAQLLTPDARPDVANARSQNRL
jgi:hypothetical protein